MNVRNHFVALIRLSWPVSLGQLGHVLTGLVDSVMVGRLGPEFLAAASLGNTVFTLFMVAGMGVAYGITPFVARADGARDRAGIADLFTQGFYLMAALALLLLLVLIPCISLIHYLDQDPHVAYLASNYLITLGISLVPLIGFFWLKQHIEGLGHTREAMIISLGGNVLNIGLNYIFIYGWGPIPAMELTGAGLGTALSRALMLWAFWITARNRGYISGMKEALNANLPSWKMIKGILGIGAPTSMQFILEVGAFSFAAIMMGWISVEALAAHQIALSLAAMTYLVASGIASGGTVRVGNALGRGNPFDIRWAGYSAFLTNAIFMAVMALLFIGFKDLLPLAFTRDPKVIEVASSLLVIAALFQISDGIQVTGLGVLRGMGDVRIPTLVTVIAYWVLGLPVSYYMSIVLGMGPEGIWAGLLLGLTFAALFHSLRFSANLRKNRFTY